MSLLDITHTDFDIVRNAWERPLSTGVLTQDDVAHICDTLRPSVLYIPDGIRAMENVCFDGIYLLDEVSIPRGCAISPYTFNYASIRKVVCRGPVHTPRTDGVLRYIPALEEATLRVSCLPITERGNRHVPLVEGCDNLKVLRLGGVHKFPDATIWCNSSLTTLLVDSDVWEVGMDIFYNCPQVKEIIPDDRNTIIPSKIPQDIEVI